MEQKKNNKEAKILAIVFLILFILGSYTYSWFLKQEIISLENRLNDVYQWYAEENGIHLIDITHTIDITPDN